MRTIRLGVGAAGVAMIGFAVYGILTSPDIHLTRQLAFLVGTLLLNDAILAPIFIVVGVIVVRLVARRDRPVVQGALIVSAAVTFVALPFVLGFGHQADIPSALPRNYRGGLALVLGGVWLATTLILVARRLISGRRRRRRL